MPIEDSDKIVAAILVASYASKRTDVETIQDFARAYDKMMLELEKLPHLKKGNFASALGATIRNKKGEG